MLAARRQTELAAVASSLSVPTHTVVCDVTKRDNVENLLAEAVAKFGRVDVWVNNVGRGISAGVLDLTDDQVCRQTACTPIQLCAQPVPSGHEAGRSLPMFTAWRCRLTLPPQVDEIITVNIKSALYGMQAAGELVCVCSVHHDALRPACCASWPSCLPLYPPGLRVTSPNVPSIELIVE